MSDKTSTRMTKQRKAILKILENTDIHPTADWIYEQVKKEIPNISLGTVYRNLNVLSEMGKIMTLDYGSSYSRFDGNPRNHYHFKCEKCEKVFDVEIGSKNTAKVIVPEDQLSLAIGKDGRNVRLAVNLTGWKIDVKAQKAPGAEEEEEEEKEEEKETKNDSKKTKKSKNNK